VKRNRLSEYLQSFFSEVKFHPKVPEVSGIGDDDRREPYIWDRQFNISQVRIHLHHLTHYYLFTSFCN
jgi:hypothetical protein